MQQLPSINSNQQAGMRHQYIAQQQTTPQFVTFPPSVSPALPANGIVSPQLAIPIVPVDGPEIATPSKKKRVFRIIAVLLAIGLVSAIYVIWHSSLSEPTTTNSDTNVSQQSFSTPDTSTTATDDDIRVYVVGAVKHPGIYTLASGARVYDLLQAAGGALPTANLVAVNLAAKLSDGQEVYVVAVGETPPTYSGGVPGTGNNTSGTGGGSNSNTQLVNINTASVDELTQNLHISKKSAQAIVDYRTQHGNFSSVDTLAQVLSSSVYNKIKAQCTV